MKKNIFYKFASPSILTMFFLMIIPLGYAMYLGGHFVNFLNVNNPEYVGMKNYRDILGDLRFWAAFRFSIITLIIVVPIQIILGFCIALLLDQLRSFSRSIYMSLILLPFIVVPVVGTVMFRQMFETGGFLSYYYRVIFGAPFLFTPTSVKILIFVHLIWHVTPYPTIVFFAGLQGLPESYLEAAEVDGASKWTQLIHIVIPHLRPLLIMTVMILIMDMYRMFDSVMVMTRLNPSFNAENLMVYSYRIGIMVQRLGRANATAILTVVGVMVVLIPFLRITYKNQLEKD